MQSKENVYRALKIFISILLFIFSLDLMGKSFHHLGINAVESIIYATSNPFIGLFIGLLITAIIQSSSTSTSIIVAMVASGSITIPDAMPMIMGANIGTTITSTIVSLGFITQQNAFRKALSAGIFHDFFNIFTVLILFPLELYYGFLFSSAIQITEWLVPSGNISNQNFSLLKGFSLSHWIIKLGINSFILVSLSFILLFTSIKLLSDNLKNIFIDDSSSKIKNYLFKNRFKSFGWGALLTGIIQSSSITTSLVVPIVAKGKVKLKNAAPFIMGANIGTTITAFIAALFHSNDALSIAIGHLLINLIGVVIFFPLSFMKNLLVSLAANFGRYVINYRLIGLLYILLTFFIIPFTLIYFNRESNITLNELVYEKKNYENNDSRMISIINKKIGNKMYDQWLVYTDGPEYERDTPTEIYNVYRNNNVLFINESYYFINSTGFCWENPDAMSKIKICIKEILPVFLIEGLQEFDSVIVYNKSIYNKKTGDSLYIQEYIDVNDKLLLIRKNYNNNRELINQQTLQAIKELD